MTDYPNCTYHGCDITYAIDQNPEKSICFKHGSVDKGPSHEGIDRCVNQTRIADCHQGNTLLLSQVVRCNYET